MPSYLFSYLFKSYRYYAVYNITINIMNLTNNPCIIYMLIYYSIMAIKTTEPLSDDNLTNCLSDKARFFLEPGCQIQRQYGVLRTYFVENLTVSAIFRHFGYLPLLLLP